jgi:curved DNA-binding protein CbpA
MPDMNILGKAADALRNFNIARRKKSLERLLVRSREFKDKLETEAKRFGIDLRRLRTGNYYEMLGIKYTADHNAIREAYHELMRKHHPDVSKDVGAEELSKKINEAYAVLKDRKLREEYDKNSFKGEVSISADATKCITRELTKKYAEAREKDFKEFRTITSVPMRRDALVAAIEDVCNWSKRFDKAAVATFGNFRNYEKNIKKLSAINKKFMQKEREDAALYKLRENGRELDELILACGKVEKGISVATKKVKEEIGAQETPITKKLRALV